MFFFWRPRFFGKKLAPETFLKLASESQEGVLPPEQVCRDEADEEGEGRRRKPSGVAAKFDLGFLQSGQKHRNLGLLWTKA
jgi:hypothetical protein